MTSPGATKAAKEIQRIQREYAVGSYVPFDEEEFAKIIDKFSDRAVLIEALRTMIGWAKYAEECDPYYFMEEVMPNWKKELAEAEAVLKDHAS